MNAAAERRWRGLAAFVGVCLSLGYGVWQYLEPHGPHEFAYAPFNVEPLPYSPMRGFTYEQLWGHVRRALLLGPGLVLLVWGLSAWVKLRAPRDLGRAARIGGGLSLVAIAIVMLVLLRGRAITDDELAYSMQATFFREGRLTGPDLGLDPLDFFNVTTPGGYTIKYLPGEPLLQVLGTLVGVPALLHVPVVGLTLWAWYHTLRRSSGERIALLGTIALGCSPMLIFTSATGLSHATSLLCVVLMGLGVEEVRAGRGLAGAALAGLSFAGGMLTRPQSMLPAAVVLGVALLVALFRTRAYRGLLMLLLSAGAGMTLLLAYNHLVTGSAFRLPWSQECDQTHFGFGRVWSLSTYEHTLMTALQNLGVVALRLNSWWLGLPLSLAVPVVFVLLRLRAPGAALWLWTGLAVLAFQFFYYSPGVSDTGSVYHYELLLPGSVMAAYVADALLTRFTSFGPLALLVGLLLGTGSWVAEQGLRMHRLVSLIHHESDRALAQVSAPALLIHERLEAESVGRGWVFSSFPRRFRGVGDAVVTLPRITPDIVERAARTYPGRQCWYFHYRPGTSRAELLRCEDAAELLARPTVDSEVDLKRVYWERPTAHARADYDPFRAIFARRARGKDGRPLRACCQLRALSRLGDGAAPAPAPAAPCLETGDP